MIVKQNISEHHPRTFLIINSVEAWLTMIYFNILYFGKCCDNLALITSFQPNKFSGGIALGHITNRNIPFVAKRRTFWGYNVNIFAGKENNK